MSKAFLIYQKFLAPNAYIQVAVTPALVEHVKNVIDAEMSEVSEGKEIQLSRELFREIEEEIENKLATKLFQPFFKSVYFAELKQRTALVEMKVVVE